jgi:hypothetical protein
MIPIPGAIASFFVVDRKWQMKIDPTALNVPPQAN